MDRSDSYHSQKLAQSDPPLGRNPWQGPCDDSIQESVFSVWLQSSRRVLGVKAQATVPSLPTGNRRVFTACPQSLCPMGSPHKPVCVLRKLVIQTEFQNCFTFIPCCDSLRPHDASTHICFSHKQHALKLPHL